jgi:hypothetical protein
MYRPFGSRGVDLHVVCVVIIVLVALITLAVGNGGMANEQAPEPSTPWHTGQFGPDYDVPYPGQAYPPTASVPFRRIAS